MSINEEKHEQKLSRKELDKLYDEYTNRRYSIEENYNNLMLLYSKLPHSNYETHFYTTPSITVEEYDILHDDVLNTINSIIDNKTGDTSNTNPLKDYLYVMYKSEGMPYIVRDLFHMASFYKEDMNSYIETILDFMLENDVEVSNTSLKNIIYAFIKNNIVFCLNKLLHLTKKRYSEDKYILNHLLMYVFKDNMSMLSEVLRVFPLLDVFTMIKLTETQYTEGNVPYPVEKLSIKLPLNIEFTVDDIAAIYKLNKYYTTPLQLSLITGVDVYKLMKQPEYSIFFKDFSNVLLDMLEESIPLSEEYKLSIEKYRYILQKETTLFYELTKNMIDRQQYMMYYIVKYSNIYKHSDEKQTHIEDYEEYYDNYELEEEDYNMYYNRVYNPIYSMFKTTEIERQREIEREEYVFSRRVRGRR